MDKTKKIVRLARKDLQGEKTIENSLRGIRGVNFMMARAIRRKAGFKKEIKLGDLSDEQLSSLSKIVENTPKFGIPHWLMNRRKDIESGIDTHLVESNLMLTEKEDLQRMKKIKSYRGVRHMFGLPVRGQRTRSSGRGGSTIGVLRKGKEPATQPAKKGGK